MICGNAWVSTDGQSVPAQRNPLAASEASRVFCEVASGAEAALPQLARAIEQPGTSDLFLVSRLGRLARSTRDRLNTRAQISERAAFGSVADGWGDTTALHRRILVTVVGGLAELERAIEQPGTSDLFLVSRLGRLARSTRDRLNTRAQISERAAFGSVADGWGDTTALHRRILVTVVGGLAELERDLTRSRRAEGTEQAKARDVRLGRKPNLSPRQRGQVLARKGAGEPVVEIARDCNVSDSVISRLRLEAGAHG